MLFDIIRSTIAFLLIVVGLNYIFTYKETLDREKVKISKYEKLMREICDKVHNDLNKKLD